MVEDTQRTGASPEDRHLRGLSFVPEIGVHSRELGILQQGVRNSLAWTFKCGPASSRRWDLKMILAPDRMLSMARPQVARAEKSFPKFFTPPLSRSFSVIFSTRGTFSLWATFTSSTPSLLPIVRRSLSLLSNGSDCTAQIGREPRLWISLRNQVRLSMCKLSRTQGFI